MQNQFYVFLFSLLMITGATFFGKSQLTKAQNPLIEQIPQIFVINSGEYEYDAPYSDYVTVQCYIPREQTIETIDTIFVQSAQDAVLKGSKLYVGAQDSLVIYDIHTHERTAATALSNISALGIRDSLLFVSRQDGMSGPPADSIFLKVLHAGDLSLIQDVEAITKDAASITFGNNKAYVAINDGFGGSTGELAEIALDDFSTSLYELGEEAKGIQNLFLDGDTLRFVCPTPYDGDSGAIGHFHTPSGTATIESIAGNLGPAAGATKDALYVIYGETVRAFSFASRTLKDTLATGRIIRAGVYKDMIYTLASDYSSWGAMQLYSTPMNRYDSLKTGIAPRIAVFDKRGIELKQSLPIKDMGVSLNKTTVIPLNQHFTDPHNPDISYSFEASSEEMVDISLEADSLFLTYKGNSQEPAHITVKATSAHSSVQGRFTVYSPVLENSAIHKVFIASGGIFETDPPYTDYVTVSNYAVNAGTMQHFDTIYTQSAQDVEIWQKDRLYVAAQDSLVVYDQERLERVLAAEVKQMKSIALTSGYIVVSRQDGASGPPPDGSYVQILNRQTLNVEKNITVSDQAAGIAIHNDTAYVAINGGWQGTEGTIAIIDLKNLRLEEINLGSAARGIETMMYHKGLLHFVCPTPYGENEGTVGHYNLQSREAHFTTINGKLKAPAYQSGDSLLLQVDDALRHYDLTTNQIQSDFFQGSYTAIDHSGLHYFATATDYFSYGRVAIFNQAGRQIAQTPVPISPAGIAIEDFTEVAAPPVAGKEIDVKIYPNPASTHVKIHANAPIEKVSMFSTTGRRIVSLKKPGRNFRLNLDEMQKGTYILRLQTAAGKTNKKLMIK